jgi:hypothetical protein
LFALQRLVKLAKAMTLLSVLLTLLCAAMIVGSQLASRFRDGDWDVYRLSSVVRSLKSDQSVVYVTASVDRLGSEITVNQMIADWLFGIPVVVPLLIVAALQLAFYLWIAGIEKKAASKN